MFFLKFEFFQKFLHIDFHYNNHILGQTFFYVNLFSFILFIIIHIRLIEKGL